VSGGTVLRLLANDFETLARALFKRVFNVSSNCQFGNRGFYGMDINKISAAVQPLLDACFAADDPVAQLHLELDRLRASGNWLEMELRQLQILTLASVKRMVHGP
jgi:hypothetical protein